jgi:hypothetical protein
MVASAVERVSAAVFTSCMTSSGCETIATRFVATSTVVASMRFGEETFGVGRDRLVAVAVSTAAHSRTVTSSPRQHTPRVDRRHVALDERRPKRSRGRPNTTILASECRAEADKVCARIPQPIASSYVLERAARSAAEELGVAA